MNEQQIVSALFSGEGRLIAAGLLFLIVWLSKRSPWLEQKLKTPEQKRIYTIALASIPAVAVVVTTGAGAKEIVTTIVTTVLGATGIHHFTQRTTPANEAPAPVTEEKLGDDKEEDEGDDDDDADPPSRLASA